MEEKEEVKKSRQAPDGQQQTDSRSLVIVPRWCLCENLLSVSLLFSQHRPSIRSNPSHFHFSAFTPTIIPIALDTTYFESYQARSKQQPLELHGLALLSQVIGKFQPVYYYHQNGFVIYRPSIVFFYFEKLKKKVEKKKKKKEKTRRKNVTTSRHQRIRSGTQQCLPRRPGNKNSNF